MLQFQVLLQNLSHSQRAPNCAGREIVQETVIAGFSFLMSFPGFLLSLPDFFSIVIAGLDPAIHVNKLALLLIWIPGSKPGDDEKEIKYPGMTKKKNTARG